MQKSLIKFAPPAIVLAVTLYWSWPALKVAFPRVAAAVGPVEAKKPTGPEFARAVLCPKFLPFPKRNPFLSADYVAKKAAKLAKSKKKREEGAIKAADAHDCGLVLNATCIMGNQRMAIINGHVYKEKDSLPQSGEDAPSRVITAIFPHKVLLSCQGEILQLGYSNLNLAAKPAGPAHPEKPAQ